MFNSGHEARTHALQYVTGTVKVAAVTAKVSNGIIWRGMGWTTQRDTTPWWRWGAGTAQSGNDRCTSRHGGPSV